MSAIIVDGRTIAQSIEKTLGSRIEKSAKTPRLDIFVVGTDQVTASFVGAKRRFAQKIGVQFVEHNFPHDVSLSELIASIEESALITDGIVVQLPLPDTLNTKRVLAAIPFEKDVDVLNEETLKHFIEGSTPLTPPVAGAIQKILRTHGVQLKGKVAAVIGKGQLVGLPTKILLEKEGVEVTVVDSKTSEEDFVTILQSADIIVSGVGKRGLVTPEMTKSGSVLIDAGTSSTGGSIEGDISKDCVGRASLISQTPGGVGPVTVATLFENLVYATEI